MDGVFDLFHYGHVRAINQCIMIGKKKAAENNETCSVIIGLIDDNDTKTYKRLPIFTLEQRTEIVLNIKGVDKVISPAPLIVTKEFIDNNNINMVVHGFADDKDFENQKEQHKVLIDMGIFERVQYTDEISTTSIIEKINKIYG